MDSLQFRVSHGQEDGLLNLILDTPAHNGGSTLRRYHAKQEQAATHVREHCKAACLYNQTAAMLLPCCFLPLSAKKHHNAGLHVHVTAWLYV